MCIETGRAQIKQKNICIGPKFHKNIKELQQKKNAKVFMHRGEP
jgi:hypothetical protein